MPQEARSRTWSGSGIPVRGGRSDAYNARKLRTLAALESRGWVNVPMLAALTAFRPTRALYTYLERLRRWRLVRRRRLAGDLTLYAISARGRERLAWLRGA